ncbi:MAG: DUF4411 family protein [Terriglobales bacterium]
MSRGAAAAPAIYSIDSSSLMDWQARYYPSDVFPGVQRRLESLVTTGRLLAAALVREEISKVGPPNLQDWLKANPGVIVPLSETLAEARTIQSRFAGLLDPKAEFEEADAYVIALARLRGAVVVTQETTAAEKRNPKRTHYIPDVCRELGIGCIAFLGLLRREGWTF